MKVSRFFLPSFDMQVKTYEPKSSIKLIGENNWWQMLGAFGLIVLLAISFAIFLSSGLPLFVLLPISLVFINSMDNARRPSYLKQEIVFDQYGILLKHSKDLNGSRQIKPDDIEKIYITITKGNRMKFSLDDAIRPNFECASGRFSTGKAKIFVQDIAQLLGLEVKNYRQFKKKGQVFELVNPSMQTECELPIETECLLYALVIEMIENELVISMLGGFKNRKKLFGLTVCDGVLTYKNWYLSKKKIAFRDINKFTSKVSMEVSQYSTNVVGRLYLETRTGRIRILAVSKVVAHSQALAQFRMEEDMKRLKEILEAEI